MLILSQAARNLALVPLVLFCLGDAPARPFYKQKAANPSVQANVSGYHRPQWSRKQLALLGKYPDDVAARKIAWTTGAVTTMRDRLGIPKPSD
jgi:hypothetical protein